MDVARGQLCRPWGGDRPADLWEVDTSGYQVLPDPHDGWGDPKLNVVSRVVLQPIPPERCRLLAVIFRKGEPLPGAPSALRALKTLGHGVHVVTDRAVGHCSPANTEAWLAEHHLPYDSITYTRDKTVVRTEVFIDLAVEELLRGTRG